MGLTQAEAARRMGISTNRLNELVRGKRGVTAATAIRLASLLGTSPELWLNLQATWDLWQAYRLKGRQRLVVGARVRPAGPGQGT